MLSFNYTNSLLENNPNGIAQSELQNSLNNFHTIVDAVASRGQGFTEIPFDTETQKKVAEFAQSIPTHIDTIIVLGIGGSMLGPQCLLQALTTSGRRKVITLDNIDPDQITTAAENIRLQHALFIVQSKSGSTPETIAQYIYFREKVADQGLEVAEHFVFVTDPEKGYLRDVARKEGIPACTIPTNVGGRFSVLTPVGLLVSEIMGIDTAQLLAGARDIIDDEFTTKSQAQSYLYAVLQQKLFQNGKNIHVLMPYSSRLRTFAHWSVQLISESLGKQYNLQGEEVRTGMTPVPALGATDQHSQLQLFAGGPHDKLITFIEVDTFENITPIQPKSILPLPDSHSYLNGVSFNQLIDAELKATRQSLTESHQPNVTVRISRVDAYHVGALIAFYELFVAYCGELMHINTFDQPGVERSKILTKEYLASPR